MWKFKTFLNKYVLYIKEDAIRFQIKNTCLAGNNNNKNQNTQQPKFKFDQLQIII